MINLLIAEDSDVIKKILKKEIENNSSEINVIDFAKNGIEAYEKTISLNPDVVIMDIRMPYLNGIEATKKILNEQLTPVIIFSSTDKNDASILEITKYPTVSFIEKPKGFSYSEVSEELIQKIKIAFENSPVVEKKDKVNKSKLFKPEIICIGASTGGPDAISEIIKNIDAKVEAPIIIIQHITEGFNLRLADWLKNFTSKQIKVVSKKESLEKNTIYLPDNASHLLISPDKKLYPSYKKLHPTFCPSVDVTFNSVAEVYREKVLGIILTGMGRDGAIGMETIYKNGGYTIAQDQASCVVFGMPKAALEKNAVCKILDYKEIGKFISNAYISGISI